MLNFVNNRAAMCKLL